VGGRGWRCSGAVRGPRQMLQTLRAVPPGAALAAVGRHQRCSIWPAAGTGQRVPLGRPVTVRGLKADDTYVFAVAVYDAGGEVVGGLGDSSSQLLMAHPLPLYSCWAQLLLAACQLGCGGPAKRAAQVLLPHFINRAARRPVWEANPTDCLSLNRWATWQLGPGGPHLAPSCVALSLAARLRSCM
jgi:hypothetical protein